MKEIGQRDKDKCDESDHFLFRARIHVLPGSHSCPIYYVSCFSRVRRPYRVTHVRRLTRARCVRRVLLKKNEILPNSAILSNQLSFPFLLVFVIE